MLSVVKLDKMSASIFFMPSISVLRTDFTFEKTSSNGLKSGEYDGSGRTLQLPQRLLLPLPQRIYPTTTVYGLKGGSRLVQKVINVSPLQVPFTVHTSKFHLQ